MYSQVSTISNSAVKVVPAIHWSFTLIWLLTVTEWVKQTVKATVGGQVAAAGEINFAVVDNIANED